MNKPMTGRFSCVHSPTQERRSGELSRNERNWLSPVESEAERGEIGLHDVSVMSVHGYLNLLSDVGLPSYIGLLSGERFLCGRRKACNVTVAGD